MRDFLSVLRLRNSLLFYFGWACVLLALGTWLMIFISKTGTGESNAWVRPTRFLFSTAVFVWTIGWLLDILHEHAKSFMYSWAVLLILLFENTYAIIFAVHQERTFTIIEPGLDLLMINLMAVGVAAITVWTGYFTWLFFTRRFPDIRRHYLWGIRFGLLFFVIFTLSGNLLSALPGWNVGSPDGSSGLPFVNWKPQNAALRTAHFLGIHALQVLPLMGYYISRRSIITILFSLVYFLAVIAIFTQAVLNQPLIELYLG